MDSHNKIVSFMKFGKESHIIDFRSGNMYMNPISYFAKCDQHIQGDSFEGIDFLHQTDNIKQLTIEVNGAQKIILNKESGLLNMKCGRISNQYTNIFCLYSMECDKNLLVNIDSRMKLFGETALIITNPDEFIRRVLSAVQREGFQYEHRKVTYYDEAQHNGDVGIFKKRARHQYMNEYRIALIANMDNKPYKLFIDDITDISLMLKSECINAVKIEQMPNKDISVSEL